MHDGQPSICLIAHMAYGAMTDGGSAHIGGVERQTSVMAKWLAARGHRVSMITWDEGSADDEVIDGVRVIKLCRQDAGIPGLRFFHPRWTSLNRALAAADANVYYHNCAEYITGQVAHWCRQNRRRFVYSVASEPDVDIRLPKMSKWRDKAMYRYGLTHADEVIVQTRRQQEKLLQGFGLHSFVIPMPCPDLSSPAGRPVTTEESLHGPVLWVGRICEHKRPDRLLELARRCPAVQFELIGPSNASEYATSIVDQARSISNVSVRGPMGREELAVHYSRAMCLACTSDVEGFPNTFLEAWSNGLPVVSMFDPDELIATRGLGAAGRNVQELAQGIRGLMASPDEWSAASERARQYYLENHTVGQVMPRFEELLLSARRGGDERDRLSEETGSGALLGGQRA